MKPLCILCFTILSITMIDNLMAQVPNPAAVEKVAIYKAIVGASDNMADNLVNYNITDKALIQALFTGMESDTLRDCSRMEAKSSAFVYVKLYNGNRQVYHLFQMYSHFSKKDDRANCFYVNPPTRLLFENNAQ